MDPTFCMIFLLPASTSLRSFAALCKEETEEMWNIAELLLFYSNMYCKLQLLTIICAIHSVACVYLFK